MPLNRPLVVVVDDDPSMRELLKTSLTAAGYHALAFDSAKNFLAYFDPAVADCVIADIWMPEIDGLQMQEHMRQQGHRTPVIFMSGNGDVTSVVRGMKFGAADFIQKPFVPGTMLTAVQAVLQRSSGAQSHQGEQSLAALSKRERQVLERVAAGLSNKEIGRDLDISPRTVEIHRSNLMRRTGARNLAQLVQIAIAAGIKRAWVSIFVPIIMDVGIVT